MPPLTLNVGDGVVAPQIHRDLFAYGANPIFGQCNSFIVEANPYYRPIRPQDLAEQDFTQPLDKIDLSAPSGLMAQRMLLNIYESDLLFLPKQPVD